MDPEPGRCRRTDGKKWRCARSVIPDQKYCDRHMHRGRLRSRTHVEVYEKISESKPDIGDKCHPIPVGGVDNKNSKSMSGVDTTYAKTTSTSNSSIQVPAKPQLVNPSLDTGNSVSFTKKSIVTSSSNGKSHANVPLRKDSSTGPIAFNPYNGNKKILKINGPMDPTFNFSPRSVLQHSKSNCGFGSSSIDNVTAVMDDSPRCRRTDGKKWRCKREVLHKQKYCAQHMHRGSKRLATALHSMVTLAKSPPPPLATPKPVDTGAGSISLAAKSPQQIGGNEYISITGSSSSSSSDATTVTDENTSDSRMLNLSP